MSDVPVEELLAQIQRHLDARQGASSGSATPAPHGDRFSAAVYDALEEASVVLDAVRVEPFLAPSQLPLIGGAWQKARRLAHDLVVYYVNRLAGAQGAFNRQITAALTALITDLDRGGRADLAAEVALLRDDTAALKAQVSALQTALDRLEQQS